MRLHLEVHTHHAWQLAATLSIESEAAGYLGPSIIDYDLDYFATFASIDFSQGLIVHDARALSVQYPVDLGNRFNRRWPPFLLDLMPQGHARRSLTTHLGLHEADRASDLPLLLRAATGGIGNIRIREAAEAEAARLQDTIRVGVTESDILGRSDLFMEVADRFAMLASGSSGLQGEWPKVAMTQASDGKLYPDGVVADSEAIRHLIVKLVRSNDRIDDLILQGEAAYSKIAKAIGLNVYQVSSYADGVLIIPRFDRQRSEDGRLLRLGQESLVSAAGVAEFGHLTTHETYIDVLREFSSDPLADVIEYLKRDIANLAFGNPDNHGRNAALSKHPDGTVRLSPLFDFAPMRLGREGVVRSTRWGCMRDINRDHLPDWQVVTTLLFSDPAERDTALTELLAFAGRLAEATDMALDLNAPAEITQRAMARCSEIAESVLSAF